MAAKQRKRGRPKTRVSKDEFVRHRLERDFVGYELERLFGEFDDSGFVNRDQAVIKGQVANKEIWSDGSSWKTFTFVSPPANEREAIAFSDGIKCAIKIISDFTFPEFLDRAMKEYGLTLNVSKIIKPRVEVLDRILEKPEKDRTKWDIVQLERLKYDPIPSDLARKGRKPKKTRTEILRLRRVIREYDGLPYLDEIAKEMNLTAQVLKTLLREARRQKISIQIGKHKGKEILIAD